MENFAQKSVLKANLDYYPWEILLIIYLIVFIFYIKPLNTVFVVCTVNDSSDNEEDSRNRIS